MTPFRDSTTATGGFGRQIVEALRRSASRSSAFKSGRKHIFLFDTDDGLRHLRNALGDVLRETRVFTEQEQNLRWALSWAHSMLFVIHGDTIEIMGHEDAECFEDILCRPRGVRRVLKEFRGRARRYNSGNLSLVAS